MAWYDPTETLDHVLARLRLASTGDIDQPLIEAQIPAAAAAIERYVDVVTPLVPDPALQEALEGVTIRLYHRAAVVATVGAGTATTETSDEPFDPIEGFRVELLAFKQQWGIG